MVCGTAWGAARGDLKQNFDLATGVGQGWSASRTSVVRDAMDIARRLSLERMGAHRAGYKSIFDQGLGRASFVWVNAAHRDFGFSPLIGKARAERVAREALARYGYPLGVGRKSVDAARLIEVHDLGRGPILVRFQQIYNGLEVQGRSLNVTMDRGYQPVAVSGYFADEPSEQAAPFSGKAELAILAAYRDLLDWSPRFSLRPLSEQHGYQRFRIEGANGDPRPVGTVRAKPVYYPKDGGLVPAWYLEVDAESIDGGDQFAVAYVIAHGSGEVLSRTDLIAEAAYGYRVFADGAAPNAPADNPLGNLYLPSPALPGQTLPRGGPPSQVITLEKGPISTDDPWLPDGAAATTGNNVDAYLDLVKPDGYNEGDLRTAVTAPGVFDYPIMADEAPSSFNARNAAVVNLFYVNNWLHNWWYESGFDEASGNAQSSNYGRGGDEGDPVLAEGQDRSGRNNANMLTYADGRSPRMQMYLFDGPAAGELRVVEPAGLGSFDFSVAAFGAETFEVNGQVVQYLDAADTLADGTPAAFTDACEAAINAPALQGKIALIDRGACDFTTKVKNAEDAGAIAALIVNNSPGDAPIAMGTGDNPPEITIGSMMIRFEAGESIKSALSQGAVTLYMRRDPSMDSDGTLDNQIIAHEHFHYVSNRLVGDGSGLGNRQGGGMGEGWSDFASLTVNVREEDRLQVGNDRFQGIYPVGFYVLNDFYYGIRRVPFSTEFDKNPLTFRHIQNGEARPTEAPTAFWEPSVNNNEVHNVGEVWATVLWEAYVALLRDPRLTFDEARSRMKDYVIAGLKMTPQRPTILEARDAILAAAMASDEQDFALIADAFGRRGMGVTAVGPDRGSSDLLGVVESYDGLASVLNIVDSEIDESYLSTEGGYCDQDGIPDLGETVRLRVELSNTGTRAMLDTIATVVPSAGLSLPLGSEIRFGATDIGGSSIGEILVKVDTDVPGYEAALTLEFPADQSGLIPPQSSIVPVVVNYDAKLLSTDDMEGAPATRLNWTPTSVAYDAGALNWGLSDAFAEVYPQQGRLWFVPDNPVKSDMQLVSPDISVAADRPFSFGFRHHHEQEFRRVSNGISEGWDGGVVEISVDGGDWVDVTTLGQFTLGGYNGRINGATLGLAGSNPLGDRRPAFVGSVEGFVQSQIDFGTALAGKSVRLRFRQGTDATNNASAVVLGWLIDDVTVSGAQTEPFAALGTEDGVCLGRPPVVVAGPDIDRSEREADGQKQATVTLSATATDLDGDALALQWTQTDGPTVMLIGAGTATPSFVAPSIKADSTLVFEVSASDGTDTARDELVVLLRNVNTDPMALAGSDQKLQEGKLIFLDGRGSSDADGEIISYTWSQQSGPAVSLAGADTAQASFDGAPGQYAFRLTVVDDEGGESSDEVVVEVTATPDEGGGGATSLLASLWLGASALWRRRRR